MSTLTLSLKTISEKELQNQKLTDAQYELIRAYGGDLEHFWMDINSKDMEKSDMSLNDFLNENPSAIVADVATDPRNGLVLEEGTGYLAPIYVIFPIDGKLHMGAGLTYTHYEFPQPIDNRLTDKAWRTMLQDKATAPALPDWKKSFTVQQ